jgi:membrane protein
VNLHGALSFSQEVWKRAGQVRAPQLVAAITLRSLTSLVPLLTAVVSITGIVASGQANFGTKLLDQLKLQDPTVRQVVQDALDNAGKGAGVALAISIVASLYSGLKVIQAVASAFDAIWQVPTRGLVDKLIGIPWLICALIIIAISGVATSLVAVIPIPVVAPVAALLGTAVAGMLLVLVSHRMLTNVRIRIRDHLPGALVAGVFLAIFQVLGTAIVALLLGKAGSVYGVVAGFFVLITVLSIFGNTLIYGAIVNVVRWEHTHGTTEMMSRAPRLPVDDYFGELLRGGQRSKATRSSRAPSRRSR